MQPTKVVVVGGGTGTSVVLSALKQSSLYDLSAIVVVSDNGGSTRRLRDEFGFLPVGDLRQCLAALADGANQDAVRSLLLYRFSKGEGLSGHNLGNLILTALEDMFATPGEAINTATKVFGVRGHVFPSTEKSVQLVITYQDGTVRIGEEALDLPEFGGQKIKHIKLSPAAAIYPPAKAALLSADWIVVGPGDLYGSILPNTLVRGVATALKKSSARLIYICNLMTHYSQTHKLSASDHVREITKYCGRSPDYIILNKAPIHPKILKSYAQQNAYPVIDDLDGRLIPGQKVIRQNLITNVQVPATKGDVLTRSLLRHDQKLLGKTLISLFNSVLPK